MAQTNSQRTKEELINSEYNYFIAFKIDVKETNTTKIEDSIKIALSSTSGSVLGRRLNELKNDAIEIMCNDAVFENESYVANKGGRKKEADRAIDFKKKEARGIIETLCRTRKTLLKSDILDICDKANKPIVFFAEEEFVNEILPYLSGLGVKIIDNIDTKIPFNDFEKTEKLLEPLNKKDLYGFLDLDNSATEDEIRTASDLKYKESTKISDLKKKQSISSLCSNVKKVLLTNSETRKTYDQYLKLKNDVWDEFAKRKSFGIKEISMDEYKDYTQTVINLLKVNVDEAEKIIAIGCKYYQLTIVGKSDDNSFEFCPFPECGKLYIRGAKSCPHCGKSLEVVCWNCKGQTRITKEDKGCPSCGATFHSHDDFIQKCQKIDQLLGKPAVEISELQSAFLAIKNVVPNYSAKPDSTISKKVNEYNGIIEQRIKQEETIGAKYKEEITKIQQLMGKRSYQTALSIAKSLMVKYSTYNVENTKKQINDLSVIIQGVNQYVDSAKRYVEQGNISLAIASAAKAIDICDDCQDARQIMQKYPPKQVSNLKIQAENGKIKLQWDDIKQDFVTYTVIKKIGVAPKSITDGTIVDNGLSVRFYEDESVVPATPYFYAVFAVRYDVVSPIISTSIPMAVFLDVANVQQEVVDSGIKVIWDNPQNIKRVEVWKKTGTVAPSKIGDGEQIDNTEKGFYDSKSNCECSYLIICKYEYDKKTVYSNGITVVFKPYEKVVPLENIKLSSIGEMQYVFSCDSGYVGKIKLYVADSKLQIPYDSILKYIEFNKICKGLKLLDTTVNANGDLTFSLSKGSIYQVYPIVNTEQLFIVSSPILINTIEGISNCSYSFSNGAVKIKGNLHQQARMIIAKVNNAKYVKKIDEDGERFAIKVDDFKRDGCFELKLKSNTINYITLFVEFSRDGVTSYSVPVNLQPPIDYREAITVLYSIDYDVSQQKKFKVIINFEADSEIQLPKMLLMQGYPRPMNKNAGKLCERIENVKLKKGFLSAKYSAKVVVNSDPTSKNTKFALFLNEESSHIQMKEVRKI